LRSKRRPGRRAASAARASWCAGVVDGAGCGDDHVLGPVARVVKPSDLGGRGARDDLGPANDGPAQRVVAEHCHAEHVKDLLLGIVLVHGDLLQDDLALGVDVGERGPEDHVGHHVEGIDEMLVDDPRVDRRGLLAGAGVQLGAHAVEDLIDLQRLVLGRALEQQVLQQVRQSRLGLGLIPRAGADPEAERHGPDGGHCLRHDPDAGLERRQAVLLLHSETDPAALGARSVRIPVAHAAAIAITVA
jgi:hypothetical protein